MLKPAKKPIKQTVILCIVTLLLTFPTHTGFMLGFVLIILAPSLLKSVYLIFIKGKDKNQRLIQTALWAATCATVIIHHAYLHISTRAFAEQVSNTIVTYHKENNTYPDAIETLGFTKQMLKNHGLAYSYKNEPPFLFYRVTWIVFDTYIFNFESNTWNYQSSWF